MKNGMPEQKLRHSFFLHVNDGNQEGLGLSVNNQIVNQTNLAEVG